MKLRLLFVLLFVLVLGGCDGGEGAGKKTQPPDSRPGWSTYYSIKKALDESGETIDYDTLLWVHEEMTRDQPPIPQEGELLRTLIGKRSDNPRIDNMILIFAAMIIRNTRYAIEDVYGLFEAMLKREDRLNSWVLVYVADAIGKYPFHIREGDRLADLLETKMDQNDADTNPPKEFFGYHFLPPPKGKYILNYIAGIQDQRIRVSERNCYYMLIKSKRTEGQIEDALRQLRTQGVPGTGQKSRRPLKYLIRHQDQFFESTETVVTNPGEDP